MAATFTSAHANRVGRAVSHYQLALSYWSTRGQPLALAHLYMALEALAPAAERTRREQLGFSSRRNTRSTLGVDVTRNNWRNVLLGWVRRDVLCRGDKATYDAAREASDGFEHGFMPLPAYRAAATEVTPKLLGYVRAAILDVLDLPEQVREALLSKAPVDTSALWWQLRGDLTGEVADPTMLAEPESPVPHPRMEWTISYERAERTPDHRLRLSPQHQMTVRTASGVQFTPTEHGVGMGLNDADAFEFEPPTSEPAKTDEATLNE